MIFHEETFEYNHEQNDKRFVHLDDPNNVSSAFGQNFLMYLQTREWDKNGERGEVQVHLFRSAMM